MALIPLGVLSAAGAAGGNPYWILGGNNQYNYNAVALDDGTYAAAWRDDSNNQGIVFLDNSGQVTLTQYYSSGWNLDLVTDGTYVYMITGSSQSWFTKIDPSDGSVVLSKYISNPTQNRTSWGYGFQSTYRSDYIFFGGEVNDTGSNNQYGNLLWIAPDGSSGYQEITDRFTGYSPEMWRAFAYDTTNSRWIAGGEVGTNASSGNRYVSLAYWSSPSSFGDKRRASDLAFSRCYYLAHDATNDQQLAAIDEFVCALNPTMTSINWQKYSTSIDYMPVVDVDDSGNVYCYGREAGGTGATYILKLDGSDGSIIWQRKMSNNVSTNLNPRMIKVIDADKFMISANETGEPFMAVLPTDGSGTGTYSADGITYTYETSSITLTNQTMALTSNDQSIGAGSSHGVGDKGITASGTMSLSLETAEVSA